MKKKRQKQDSQRKKCLFLRHFGVRVFATLLLLICSAHHVWAGGRVPSSTIPSDDLVPLPIEKDSLYHKLFIYDDAGVLQSTKVQISHWRVREEHIGNWNLRSTGLYSIPQEGVRKRYLRRQALRYVDKRLSGEIKRADEKSALHQIGRARNVLRANLATKVYGVKLRAKVRLLERKFTLRVKNPWVKSELVGKGRKSLTLRVGRRISSLKIKTQIGYEILKRRRTAIIERDLVENLKLRVISVGGEKGRQDWEQQGFGRRFELLFQQPF